MAASMGITLRGVPNGESHSLGEKWRWFVALGVADLILGGGATPNLMQANPASVLFIGVAVLLSGLLQIIHAFSAQCLQSFLFWLLGSLVYATAGWLVLYDPVLASLDLSLLVGAFLVVAGIARGSAGFDLQPTSGWPWIVASGVLTFCIGIAVIAIWPLIGIRLFAAMLVLDLIIHGASHVALARCRRHVHG
jgi:uncharacterized membrane protein HdeD (DUF308 family)